MAKLYKLLSKEFTSHGEMKWEMGKTNKATESGTTLCSSDLLHCYSNKYLAILFNPIHANFQSPRLIEVECSEILANDGLKQGCKEQTPIREITLPVLSTLQRVEFAIRVAMLQYTEEKFIKWAKDWISGVDRTEAAAWSAARSAEAAAWSAAWSAVWSARYAAWSAARYAAWSAEAAAWYAAWSAARYAERVNKEFIAIITEIIERDQNV